MNGTSAFSLIPQKMVDQLTRYESYASIIKRMVLFAGLWPGRESTKFSRTIVIIHVLPLIITSSAMINFVVSHITNLGVATKGLGIAVGFFGMILKVIIFTIHRDKLVELHGILEMNFRHDLANLELRPVLLSPLEYFYRPFLWLALLNWAVLGIFFSTPPISMCIQLAHGVSPIQYRLPFPTQYPWNVTGNYILYTTQYVIEVYTGLAVAVLTTSTDALFGFYIFQMSSQFRIISYRMTNLKATDDYHAVIKECATRHRSLIHCRDNLQLVYGPIILWMLVGNALSLCGNIFQASQVKFNNAAIVILYVSQKLLQTLLFGWYGVFLTNESESFRKSVYCCGWPGTGQRSFMSNICVMLMYQPLVLTACHFSVVSLNMFMSIVNTALSYFFLLRTLEQK